MSQTQQTPPALKPLNIPSIITYIDCGDGTIIIVSIVLSDGKTHVFGNGIGTIVPTNRVTWKKESQTLMENQKQYTILFENKRWDAILGGIRVHTFDEIFGLLAEITRLENVLLQAIHFISLLCSIDRK